MFQKVNMISFKDVVESEYYPDRNKKFADIAAIILFEGYYAEKCSFDKFRPGSFVSIKISENSNPYVFQSPFTEFSRDGEGFGAAFGDYTCCSIFLGKINGKKVLFVTPTSQTVNYKDIEDTCKSVFPDVPVVECDTNFTNKLSRAGIE